MSVRIVLVGTTHPGNIGAVARAMKNMGVADLALGSALDRAPLSAIRANGLKHVRRGADPV